MSSANASLSATYLTGHPTRSVRASVVGSTLLLLLLAPLLLLISAAVLISSPGPVLCSVPRINRDGRLSYRTEFRTRRTFDPETYETLASRPERWLTPVGGFLEATRLARLPVLLDVRAGRTGLIEALKA